MRKCAHLLQIMVDKKLIKVSAADGGRQIVASASPLILDPRPKTRGPACQMQIKQGGSRFKEGGGCSGLCGGVMFTHGTAYFI